MPDPARRPRLFRQVDVFTDTPLRGNPVAVLHDSTGLATEGMHAFTDWTNLSECTCLAPPQHPQADYAVRIFCPGRELPFAGHPTLGTCHAWLEAGGVPQGDVVVQECGVGLVRIRRQGDVLAFAAPPLQRSGPLDENDLDRIARGLGITRGEIVDHQWCDNGPPWRSVLLASAEQVLALRPDVSVLSGLDVGVAGLHPAGSEEDLEVRAFFTKGTTVEEDPVTGSLNAALAQWLIASGRVPPRYVSAQGTALGRTGRVRVEQDGEDIWIGGRCVTVLEGTASI
jgi:PhzF family phenazine biosynthesis protein